MTTATRALAIVLLMVTSAVRLAPAAMCGCDKFSPGPAEALRSGGQLRPTVASRGSEVVLFSDALTAGQAYTAYVTPIPGWALPGWGAYLAPVRAEPAPRTCTTPGIDDGQAPDANPVAVDLRDLADYQPLLSLDGSGPNLAAVQTTDFPLRTQLRITVPCALPKLGGARIDVYAADGTLVLSAEEDEFTAIGDPLPINPDAAVDQVYVTGVDTTGHLYVALDLSQALDAVTLSGYAKTLALDIDPADVAAFDVHGAYLDSLRDVLGVNTVDSASQALFDFDIVDGRGARSDEVDYFRHSFTDWAAQHVPPFGPNFPGKFQEDPSDPSYWHLPDDPLHPFGSTHTTFDHIVVAIAARWRPTASDGSGITHDLRPGGELRFALHVEAGRGDQLPMIDAQTQPAVNATPAEARWHRRGHHRRLRHRHRRPRHRH